MDRGSGTPGGERIEIRGERIEKALGYAWKVHRKQDKPFHVEKVSKKNPPEVFIGFPGSGAVKDWYSEKPFGECEIDLKLFPSLKRIGHNEAAKVNEAFQTRFQAILVKPSLENKVEKALKNGKQIVFTGHSSGAPMAVLATLWTLEKYITPKSHGRGPLLCVTSGSPLVGNHVFSHAIRRQNWSYHFMHFVMRYDIVPRILFTPLLYFDQRFEAISQSFNPKSKSFMSESIGRSTTTAASDFYFAVMSNATTVTSHAASKLMGTTDSTLETLANFVPLSPYRPFGTYIFCTENGKKIVIKASDAVLQVLFFSAQLSTEAEADQVATRSLQEHRVNGTKQQLTLGMQNVVYLDQDQLEELPLTDDHSRDDISVALNDLGLLSNSARLCVRAAAQLEKRRNDNGKVMKKKVDSVEENMSELEKYRDFWKLQKVGYYDAFRQQKDPESFQANVKRLELSSVWDEIIGKLWSFELPDEFEGESEWVKLGTRFRRLVEPLDVANYYRHLRHVECGTYLVKCRPMKYRFMQRWLEHAEGRWVEPEAYSESCFWAEVEDLCFITNNNNNNNNKNGSFEDVKERAERLENKIKTWIDNGELDKDVFVEGSTLVKWWKALPPQHREVSCIRSCIEV